MMSMSMFVVETVGVESRGGELEGGWSANVVCK